MLSEPKHRIWLYFFRKRDVLARLLCQRFHQITRLAQRGVRRERIGEHRGCKRVVVGVPHAANLPNGSSYDRCVELASCLADTDALLALDAAHDAAWDATDARQW